LGGALGTAYNSTEGCLICIFHVDNREKVVEMPRNLPYQLRYCILAQHKRTLNEPSWKTFSIMFPYGSSHPLLIPFYAEFEARFYQPLGWRFYISVL
jgi:hypothetical protein